MKISELIKKLQGYDDDFEVQFHTKLIGNIMPEEIIAPIKNMVLQDVNNFKSKKLILTSEESPEIPCCDCPDKDKCSQCQEI